MESWSLITGTKACASPVISVCGEAQNVWKKMKNKNVTNARE